MNRPVWAKMEWISLPPVPLRPRGIERESSARSAGRSRAWGSLLVGFSAGEHLAVATSVTIQRASRWHSEAKGRFEVGSWKPELHGRVDEPACQVELKKQPIHRRHGGVAAWAMSSAMPQRRCVPGGLPRDRRAKANWTAPNSMYLNFPCCMARNCVPKGLLEKAVRFGTRRTRLVPIAWFSPFRPNMSMTVGKRSTWLATSSMTTGFLIRPGARINSGICTFSSYKRLKI